MTIMLISFIRFNFYVLLHFHLKSRTKIDVTYQCNKYLNIYIKKETLKLESYSGLQVDVKKMTEMGEYFT